jgi:nucleoside-diphosphate-sugar epimerase
MVPDPTNPRYSYGGGKIISELMALNYGRKFFERVLIFRPHNVYGPDMGWEHVVPQFARRVKDVAATHPAGRLPFEMQGNGRQTRSFCHVDDLVSGVLVMRDKGTHLGIYHVGTLEEITIADLASRVAAHGGREIELIEKPAPVGGTERRCPDIAKLAKLGYKPKVTLAQGLGPTVDWYWANENLAPDR